VDELSLPHDLCIYLAPTEHLMQGRGEELLRACADTDPDLGNEALGAAGRRIKSEDGRRGRDGDGVGSGSGAGSGLRGKLSKADAPSPGLVMPRLAPHQPVPTLSTYRLDPGTAPRAAAGGSASARASSGRVSRNLAMNSAR
jgi:hypothetical protein